MTVVASANGGGPFSKATLAERDTVAVGQHVQVDKYIIVIGGPRRILALGSAGKVVRVFLCIQSN